MIMPTALNNAIKRLDNRINEMNLNNLEEYTIGSCIGCELTDLYKDIMEEAIGGTLVVNGDEISDGKYEIEFMMPNGKSYFIISKAGYSNGDIRDVILEVLYCHYENLNKVGCIKLVIESSASCK